MAGGHIGASSIVLSGDDMRAAYPKFDDFAKLRAEFDPEGRLLNPICAACSGSRDAGLFCQAAKSSGRRRLG